MKSCSSLQLVITSGLTKWSGTGTSLVDGWLPSPYLVCSRGSGCLLILISAFYYKRFLAFGAPDPVAFFCTNSPFNILSLAALLASSLIKLSADVISLLSKFTVVETCLSYFSRIL